MRDSEDIQQLIEQLRILQLQQTDILDRIDVARSSQEYNSAGQRARATAETTSRRERRERNSESRVTTREFIVGDYVIIRNPNPLQADRGIIEKNHSQSYYGQDRYRKQDTTGTQERHPQQQ
jgi:hypothetical protein